jgi:hypothetical protein
MFLGDGIIGKPFFWPCNGVADSEMSFCAGFGLVHASNSVPGLIDSADVNTGSAIYAVRLQVPAVW